MALGISSHVKCSFKATQPGVELLNAGKVMGPLPILCFFTRQESDRGEVLPSLTQFV